MRYRGTVYRPPSEAGSLVIQATFGCPHNHCAFCGMYRGTSFARRPLAEIVEDLDAALTIFGPGLRTIFLADGNTACLPTATLVAIAGAARARFPELARITMYGSAKFLAAKSLEEWRQIAAAGITRIHSGLESGDAVTLAELGKGVDPAGAARAFGHVMAAGIELSVYIMVGVAGLERWREHAEGSARVLNLASPDFVRLRTFVPVPGTPWCERWQRGELTLLDPYQALVEVRRLVELIAGPTTLLSDHLSNFLDVRGRLPENRGAMLTAIDDALGWPRERFRPPTGELVGLAL
ncbi:MAG: radical SAM protein [Thermoanaerobaculales bacterium]|nr:radical SAM protein [Thermoanaerobaculales bacterium]